MTHTSSRRTFTTFFYRTQLRPPQTPTLAAHFTMHSRPSSAARSKHRMLTNQKPVPIEQTATSVLLPSSFRHPSTFMTAKRKEKNEKRSKRTPSTALPRRRHVLYKRRSPTQFPSVLSLSFPRGVGYRSTLFDKHGQHPVMHVMLIWSGTYATCEYIVKAVYLYSRPHCTLLGKHFAL